MSRSLREIMGNSSRNFSFARCSFLPSLSFPHSDHPARKQRRDFQFCGNSWCHAFVARQIAQTGWRLCRTAALSTNSIPRYFRLWFYYKGSKGSKSISYFHFSAGVSTWVIATLLFRPYHASQRGEERDVLRRVIILWEIRLYVVRRIILSTW